MAHDEQQQQQQQQQQEAESLLPVGEAAGAGAGAGEHSVQVPARRSVRWRLTYYVDEGSRRLLTRAPEHTYRALKRMGYSLTPTLIRSLVWHEQAPASKMFPTSYLNGLRGLTAVKVYTFHYTFAYSDFGFQPWGVDERHRYFLELPIIRYFYSGFTSHVFFGIAGYLTALRLFQLLERTDAPTHQKVFQNISGSMFRRALRLYMPVFAITLITTTYIHYGFYETYRDFIIDHANFPGEWNEPKPPMFDTWYEQLDYWCREMFGLSNIITEATVYPWHDQHLWSILSEMRASLHLYGILIALAQCKKQVRLGFLIFLTLMYFMWNHWEIWVYILGAIVAQVDIMLTDRDKASRETLPTQPPPPPPPPPPEETTADGGGSLVESEKAIVPGISRPLHEFPHLKRRFLGRMSRFHSRLRTTIRYLAFFVAFYFLSYPIDGAEEYAPGYMWMNTLIPEWMVRKDKFYPNLGTGLLILLLARSNPDTSKWRKFLTSPIPLYMGKISFALYLVHGPLMHAFGYMIPHQIAWAMGTELGLMSNNAWVGAIVTGWAITLVASLWAADVWTREVENRCVKAVKYLEKVCFLK